MSDDHDDDDDHDHDEEGINPNWIQHKDFNQFLNLKKKWPTTPQHARKFTPTKKIYIYIYKNKILYINILILS